jgi:hypothetical protein
MPKPKKLPLPEYAFVRFELSRSEKAAFAATLPPDMAKVWDTLYALLEDGHKISLSYDANNVCYVASLTCNSGSRTQNHHAVLSARADNPDVALALLVYKDELLEGHWPTGNDQTYNFG